jgi:hypothetical protein
MYQTAPRALSPIEAHLGAIGTASVDDQRSTQMTVRSLARIGTGIAALAAGWLTLGAPLIFW